MVIGASLTRNRRFNSSESESRIAVVGGFVLRFGRFSVIVLENVASLIFIGFQSKS